MKVVGDSFPPLPGSSCGIHTRGKFIRMKKLIRFLQLPEVSVYDFFGKITGSRYEFPVMDETKKVFSGH